MSRLLLILIFGVLVFLAIRALRRFKSYQRGDKRIGDAQEDSFVACAHCGIHVPQRDAIRSGPLVFCSEAHRKLGKTDP
ncbi:MAG: preprotein translocase subunit YajC [Rhodocyclaceae bacterium]|jgi:uncharacterized protein|nr:preprotein translocase subunit YajC [Rhodocyclaceae bacterium]MBK6908195.1 preprotein translocase subunit YajC [Rhodocyclaceae bacterium]